MTLSRVNISKLEWECINLCSTLNEFIEKMKSERHLFPRFFNNNSEEIRSANFFLEEVRKTTTLSTFPNLSFHEENKFIKSINDFYKKLIGVALDKICKKQDIDTELMDFLINISIDLKAIIKIFFMEIPEINLSYLCFYLSSREAGFDIPSNYFILKTETLNILKHYLNISDNRNLCKILGSSYDTLIQLNSTEDDFKKNPIALLRILNNLRLKLVDAKEEHFLILITEVMDHGLEIIRSNFTRGWKMQNSLMVNVCDPITIKLTQLDNISRNASASPRKASHFT